MDSPDPTAPIPVHLFALALKELPLDTLYAKAAELHNSIAHLLSSNIEMKPYADDGDDVCREAIVENDIVIARMEDRIRLCREEVEGRGQRWSTHGANEEEVGKTNGLVNGDGGTVTAVHGETDAAPRQPSGRLTDEELRRQLDAQLGGVEDDEEEDGIHL